MVKSPMKNWIINIQRTAITALAMLGCILLGDSLDKFNSLVGTFAAAPIAFTIPCVMHYYLCQPTPF